MVNLKNGFTHSGQARTHGDRRNADTSRRKLDLHEAIIEAASTEILAPDDFFNFEKPGGITARSAAVTFRLKVKAH